MCPGRWRRPWEAIAADADGLVAVGGGSSIGLAKAMAVRLGLPIVAVPVTYSGSEMSAVYGLTDTRKLTRAIPKRCRWWLSTTPNWAAASAGGLPPPAGSTPSPTPSKLSTRLVGTPRRRYRRWRLSGCGRCAVGAGGPAGRHRGADGSAVGSLPGRVGDRHCRHRLAAQARSRAGRSARPAPCRGARRAPAIRNRIQPICGGRPVGGAAQALGAPGRRFRLVAAEGEVGNPASLAELGLDEEVLDEAAEQTVSELGAANPRPVDQRGVSAACGRLCGQIPEDNGGGRRW